MAIPRMFYFGPWDQAGHYFFAENGYSVQEERIPGFPFGHYGNRIPVDGCLQPGCRKDADGHWNHRGNPEVQGDEATQRNPESRFFSGEASSATLTLFGAPQWLYRDGVTP